MEIRPTSVLPGRLRVKVDRLKGNHALAQEIQRRIQDLAGIRHVEVSPITGSVLIQYDVEGASPGTLGDALGVANAPQWERALAEAAEGTSTRPEPGRDVLAALFRSLNSTARAATGGLPLGLLVPYTLIALGVRQLLVTDKFRLPGWHDLFWYAFGTYAAARGLTADIAAGRPTSDLATRGPAPNGQG